MSNGKIQLRSFASINEELKDLYYRRTEVDNLIRCLEEYSDVQAKISRREQLKSA